MFPNLNAEMARKDLNYLDVAKVLGVCPKTAYNKITGATPFTLNETILIRDKYFKGMTLEKLFLTEKKGT